MTDMQAKRSIEDYQELPSNIRTALMESIKALASKGHAGAASRLSDAIAMTVSKKRMDPSMIGHIGLTYIKGLELYADAGLEKYLPMLLGDDKKAAPLVKTLKDISALREQAKPEHPAHFMERILLPNKIEVRETATILKNDEAFRAALEEIRRAVDLAISEAFRPAAHVAAQAIAAKTVAHKMPTRR